MMTRLVPKIFFDRMSEGLDLFVNARLLEEKKNAQKRK